MFFFPSVFLLKQNNCIRTLMKSPVRGENPVEQLVYSNYKEQNVLLILPDSCVPLFCQRKKGCTPLQLAFDALCKKELTE